MTEDQQRRAGTDAPEPPSGPPSPEAQSPDRTAARPEPVPADLASADLASADLASADLASADLASADLASARSPAPSEPVVPAPRSDSSPGELPDPFLDPPAPPEAGEDRPGGDRRSGESQAGVPRRRRVSAAGAVIGLLLGLLGFALVVQLRSNAAEDQLSSERPEDLVRILSDLDSQKDRLSQEISQQQTLKQQLTAGTQSRQAALDQASQRADALGILAGTLPAEGPGLRVQFKAASKAIRASDVLDTVEELRGAGAEAMQISGKAGAVVRIVASTSFVDGANGTLVVDGETLNGPYTITVIGDPSTMQIALNIPSGVVDTVHSNGGTVSVIAPGTVQVTALHQNAPLRYAKPVS